MKVTINWLREFVDVERFDVGETVLEGETRYVVAPRGARGCHTGPIKTS